MKMIRRALAAIGMGAIIAAAVRLRGSKPVLPGSGGWRELTAPDFD